MLRTARGRRWPRSTTSTRCCGSTTRCRPTARRCGRAGACGPHPAGRPTTRTPVAFDAVRAAVADAGPGARVPTRARGEARGRPSRCRCTTTAPTSPGSRSCTGLDEAEVVARHTAGDYRSGFCGFAPGFAYLTGLDETLHVPRRDDPRTKVPAGSVGLADEFTAVYPRDSPGGWQLIGHTDITVWDTRPGPAGAADSGHAGAVRRAGAARDRGDCLEVVRTGALATVQDLGRPGLAHLGVSRSGAADRGSLRLANRLVGNAEAAAASRWCSAASRCGSTRPLLVALTGAPCPVRADGRRLAMDGPLPLRAGDGARARTPVGGPADLPRGCAGAWTCRPVLGSRSTDTLSGLGPEPLAEGDRLPWRRAGRAAVRRRGAAARSAGRAGAARPGRPARRLVRRRRGRAVVPDPRGG